MCESCIAPGYCCRDMSLSGGRDGHYFHEEMTEFQAAWLAAFFQLPFVPLRQDDEGFWRWRCTALDEATGRCTIYENRPQLCRDYAAGSDPLCVHYWPAPDDYVSQYPPEKAVEV